MRLVLILILLVLGCEPKIVDREEAGVEETQTLSCIYYGHCFGSSIGAKGKSTYGYRFGTCHGTRRAVVRKIPFYWHYESRPGEKHRSIRTEEVRVLKPCG